ncbi:MAG: nitronate monooxygenase [Syntrophales bacterium]
MICEDSNRQAAAIKTPFTKMIGIRYPIIGAPMFLVTTEELVVAVCNTGALGTLPLPNYRTMEQLKAALKRIRLGTTMPVGINIHLSGRFPWKEQLHLCLDYGIRFFITVLGDPGLIVSDVHAQGGKVFSSVVSLEHALKASEKGVDGIIAVGAGAGGHGGTVPVPILVPYLKEKTGLPIVAAGGISTGAQMASAMAVGASAVMVGTRLIAAREAGASDAYKKAVVEAGPEDIIYTDRITGDHANWLANSIANFQTQPSLSSKRWRDIWSAGQSVAQVKAIQHAAVIIQEIAEEYTHVCQDLQTTLS